MAVVILRRALLVIAACGAIFGMRAATAQSSPVADFYRGKSIYMIIGDGVGGGFDVYGRLVARYLGKYIPGNPTILPQNLPGGGSFRAAEKVAVSAPQDGTFIGAIHASTLLDPIMGDPRKKAKRLDLAYLGSASKNLAACFVRADAPVQSFADLQKKQLIVGAGNDASTTREFSSLLKNLFGAKLKISAGYTGNGEIFLAVDRGEVQGMCGAGYIGVTALRPNWLKSGFARIIVQENIHGIPALNALHIPRTLDFVKTDEQRKILEVFYSQQEFGRPFVVGAKVPPDRISALQSAFERALDDPDLRREAQAINLDISPLSATEVETFVSRAYSTPPEVLAKLRQALGYVKE